MPRSIAEVDALDSQLVGQLEAANTAALACTALPASDLTVWSNLYSSWSAVHEQWQAGKSTTMGGFNWFSGATLLIFTDGIYDRMQEYAKQLPAWQARIHAVCPQYTPPPGILGDGGHDAAMDWVNKAEEVAKVIAGATMTVAVGLVVIKVVQVVGDIRQAAKA